MDWKLEFSTEVAKWLLGRTRPGKAEAERAFDRLAALGQDLQMPHSKPLGKGLFELRFDCENKAVRVTYMFEPEQRIITLTQFHKQQNNEQKEILRARRALRQRRERGIQNG